MHKIIISALFLLLLTACSSTGNTTQKREKVTIPEINLLEIDYYSESEIDDSAVPLVMLSDIQGKVDYPAEARKKGLEGRVVVEVLITTEGQAYITSLKESIHPLLDNQVLYAIKDTNFKPSTINGKPVNVLTTIPVIFGLQKGINRNLN